ncbi:MAG: 2-oxo acid dehydrogenase subunit E2 [Actinobacteria bacterium]|nr:2-oxo acid dehydrogenase subunit E2 [Actinomycetota bacterium]
MATDFLMPKLGLTMEEGTILEWLVPSGQKITPGTAVLRIETDKVESDVEAAGEGILHHIAEVGSTHPCGAVIALLLADGEQPPAANTPAPVAAAPAAASTSVAAVASVAPTAPSRRDGRQFVSPNARRRAAELGVDLNSVVGTGPDGRIVSEDVELAATRPRVATPVASPVAAGPAVAPIVSATGQVLATAAARQLAELLGVDLAAVPYDAQDGRVTRDAVATYVRQRLSAATASPSATSSTANTADALPPASQAPTSVKKMSGMRGTIAKRMHASLQQMAQLTLTMDADLDAVIADRDARENKPGFTDYVIAAAARALRAHPIVNSQVTSDGIALLPDVHVGMAVALDEGLVVPVVRNADRLDLTALAAETKRLATAARGGSLALNDLEGGTFSVSALGMFGVDAFTPVINPPNSAILGVGRLRDDLVLGAKGKVSTTKRLTLSLTWDHRVFDGAPAAQFAQTIVELLNDPKALDAVSR